MDTISNIQAPDQNLPILHSPYSDKTKNILYNLLFGDNINLFKEHTRAPISYPFDILISEASSITELQKAIDDLKNDSRSMILAYNTLLKHGFKPIKKELLGIVVEVSLDEGLDVLASFRDGSARFISYSEKIIIWETTLDEKANKITSDLFAFSQIIVDKIGPWDKPRLPNPAKGNLRLTFLVSDGLYFGEGIINSMFNDPLAGPALQKATELMDYISSASITLEV